MSKETFYIDPSYNINPVCYFDDTSLKDEWQKEVYQYAKIILTQNDYKTIVDFGCGSGYKLVKNFNDYNTIGVDLPKTVEFLNQTYPDKKWINTMQPIECDIFLAADVIEHMTNPNELLDYIEKCNPKEIILSTPDRTLDVDSPSNGPPDNIHHIREWSFKEFEDYIESRFTVVKHIMTNKRQRTQLIHAKIRD